MTPSQQAKAAGLKSLAEVARMTGYTEAGLYSCAKKRPELFDVILLGCAAKDWMNRRDDDLPWFLKSQNS